MGQFRVFSRGMVVHSLVIAGSLLLSGVSFGAETPLYGGVMKVVDMAEGGQPLGVPWEDTTIDTKLMTPVIETLLVEDTSGKLYPHLATGYKVDTNGKTITFTLRKGITFSGPFRWTMRLLGHTLRGIRRL